MVLEHRYALAFVEDSAEDYALFTRVFRGVAQMSRWENAEDALAAFASGEVPLAELSGLVVDLNLPGMDGVALIERTRALPDGEHPMICMLSSSERPEDAQRAVAAGADGYLVKPDDLRGLRRLPELLAAMSAAR